MSSKLLVGLLVSLTTFAVVAKEDEFLLSPPPGDRPIKVLMGFNLVNISDVGEKDETIDFEGAIYLEWMDSRLAYDPEEYGMRQDWKPGDYSRAPGHIYQGDFAVKEIYQGWRPHLVIPNGIGNRTITNMAVSIWPDGRIVYSETFYTKAETPMDLRRFPFDSQELEVFFHPFIYHRDEVILVPDDRLARTWNQNLGIVDWTRESVTMREQSATLAYFDESTSEISEFVVTLRISRRPTHILVSIIFPLALLVSLTWCVYWMDESLSDRLNVTFIGIVSVVAYYFVVLETVPETNYLTLTDAFLTATFLILAAGVVVSTVIASIERRGKVDLAAKVDRVCRWAFPLAYAIVTFVVAIVFFAIL